MCCTVPGILVGDVVARVLEVREDSLEWAGRHLGVEPLVVEQDVGEQVLELGTPDRKQGGSLSWLMAVKPHSISSYKLSYVPKLSSKKSGTQRRLSL